MIVISTKSFRLLSPLLYLNRILCLLPLKWTKKNTNYVIEKSRGYLIYSNVTIIFIGTYRNNHGSLDFLVVSSIYGFVQLCKLPTVYQIRLGDYTKRFITIVDLGFIYTPIILGVVITSIKIDKYIDFIDNLNKVDSYLQRYPQRGPKHLVVVVVTMLFASFLLIHDLKTWLGMTSHDDYFTNRIIKFLPFHCSYFILIYLEVSYWQLVNFIRIRIISLNQKLEIITNGSDNFSKNPKKIPRNTIDVMMYHNTTLKKLISSNQIEDLIMAYQKLIEAASIINDCYGLIILIVILGCFIHLLVTPYHLYCFLLSNSEDFSSSVKPILSQLVWCFCHFMRLLLIIEPCHGCLVKAKITSRLVCKLLCYHSRDEIKTLLEIFFKNLSQCKIEFTVFGMTRISRGLLATIAGAVATYLVILFQYKDV